VVVALFRGTLSQGLYTSVGLGFLICCTKVGHCKLNGYGCKKTDPNKPWSGLEFPIQQHVKSFFSSSIVTMVGNGCNTLFWTDRWVDGSRIQDFAPAVVANVGKRALSSRTVAHALENWQWVSDIVTPLNLSGLQQYLNLWDTLRGVVLTQEADRHVWIHSSSGQFSSKSCYKAFFLGSITFEPWKRLWEPWAPPKCKFFIWLAIRNKCWTADILQKRGLDHPEVCPLCDQEPENIQHLLCTCIFRGSFGITFFLRWGWLIFLLTLMSPLLLTGGRK
jgi:hypothetical protein